MYFYILILCLNTITSTINTNAFFDFLELVRLVGDGSLGIGRLGQSEGAARTIAARQPARVREVFVVHVGGVM